MLYASTRNALTKSLGSSVFTDSIFATCKADVTADAYVKHRKHMAAPKPLSTREQEMADVRAAEREAGGGSYEGSRARQNHLGTGVGLNWSPEVEEAVKELGSGEESRLLVIVSSLWFRLYFMFIDSGLQSIDTLSETLVLKSAEEISVEQLGSALPATEPCMFNVLNLVEGY
jgi:twinfilin-like protein